MLNSANPRPIPSWCCSAGRGRPSTAEPAGAGGSVLLQAVDKASAQTLGEKYHIFLGTPRHPSAVLFGRNRMPEILRQEASFISKRGGFAKHNPAPPSFNTVCFGEGKQTKLDQAGRRWELPSLACNGLHRSAWPGISRFLSFFGK